MAKWSREYKMEPHPDPCLGPCESSVAPGAGVPVFTFCIPRLDRQPATGGEHYVYRASQFEYCLKNRVQNGAARAVFGSSKLTSATVPLLKSLHWLPVEQRLVYKIGLLTFKAKTTNTPIYLRELMFDRTISRSNDTQNNFWATFQRSYCSYADCSSRFQICRAVCLERGCRSMFRLVTQ